ncbi:MAG: signal peptidase II [Planctomycetota bacterium]
MNTVEVAPDQTPVVPPPRLLFAGKIWFWLPWPPLLVLDLWSKAKVFAFMVERYKNEGSIHEVFDSNLLTFQLVTWRNPGTIWGLFQQGTVPLMVLRCLAVVGMLWFVSTTARAARQQLLILSLIFAGAIGNLYDNFTEPSRAVRDFLRFRGEWPMVWDFPAFNVADSCITVGAFGMILLLLREDRATEKVKQQVSS